MIVRCQGYFRVGMVGYLAGFLTTFIALVTMEMAQPALLYLGTALAKRLAA